MKAPREAVTLLSTATSKPLVDIDIRKRITQESTYPVVRTSEGRGVCMKDELAHCAKMIGDSGLK